MEKRRLEGTDRLGGMDALRVLAMMMITIHHCFIHWGVIDGGAGASWKEWIPVMLANCACLCAVDTYVLLSGYLHAGRKHRTSRIAELWLQVWLYSVGLTALMMALFPGARSIKSLLWSLFPVAGNMYWFFTQYFGLFLLMPFLNRLMEALRPERQRGLILTAVALSVMECAARVLRGNGGFGFQGGTKLIWFVLLYFVGAYLRMRTRRPEWLYRPGVLPGIFATSVTVVCLSNLVPSLRRLLNGAVTTHCSPVTLLASVCLLLMFERVKAPRAGRVLRWMSPAAFGVYLISDHPLVREYVLADRLLWLGTWAWPAAILGSILISAAVFAVCIAIDRVRMAAFEGMRIRERLGFLDRHS